MSEISSNQSLNKILDQLCINKTKEKFAPREVKDQLGQDDFLKLAHNEKMSEIVFGCFYT